MWYNKASIYSRPRVVAPTTLACGDASMTTIIPQKQCSKCRELFPATSEYFHRDKKSKDGLRNVCKICQRTVSAVYYLENADKIKSNVAEWQRENYDKWYGYEKNSRHKNPEPSRNSVKRYRRKYPEKTAAREAVKHAVQVGKIPSATTCTCELCGSKARAYHHWSYLPEHRLDVIPLCPKCHSKVHQS